MLNPGEVVNQRYRVVKVIAKGGFGAVYRAWDINFNMPCALKENLEVTPESQRQFEREARMLRSLKHVNLPLVIDYFTIPGKGQYLVMDYVEGQDLQTLVETNNAPLSPEQACEWMLQVCQALEYLHTQNPPIIHRDIKPANIRITPHQRAILVDFGIAKVFDPQQKTTTGARAVTPGYAPCEQYGRGRTDERSDIYALGATLYYLLTATQPLESVQRVVNDELPMPREINPQVPASLEAVILKAMHIDPAKRYQSVTEFEQALSLCMAEPQAGFTPVAPTLVAPSPEGMEQPRLKKPLPARWLGIGAIGIVVICALSLLAVFGVAQFIRGDDSGVATQSPLPGEVITSSTIPANGDATPPVSGDTLPGTLIPLISSCPDFPEDIPIMPGATDFYSMRDEQSKTAQCSFNVIASAEEILNYYERAMVEHGWTNFQSFSSEQSTGAMYRKNNFVVSISVTQVSGKNWVSITLIEG